MPSVGDEQPAFERESELRWESHEDLHEMLALAITKAETASVAALSAALADHHREHLVHEAAHEREHHAHGVEHTLNAIALDKADSAARAALKAALDDHHREHLVHETAHGREHAMNAEAIRVADTANDKRLATLNEFRAQLSDQAKTFASTERLDALIKENDRRFGDTTKHTDERFESNRLRIENLEKGDVQSTGRSLGQGQVIGWIVTAIVLTGIVVGIATKLLP